MQLYQLALELDEQPAEMAQRAEALGLGRVEPWSELTPDQVDALRASSGRPASAPEPPVTVIAPTRAPVPPGEGGAPPKASSGRGRKIAIAVGCLAAFAAVVAFFAVQSSPAEELREQRNEELADWDASPPATIAASQIEAASFPGDQPRDRAKLCAAFQTSYDEESSSPEVDEYELDWTEFREWAADRGTWLEAVNEMIHSGPTDAVPDITTYRDVREQYYAILAQASDPELRALSQGTELNALEGYEKDVDDARDDMDFYLVPICGAPG